MPPEMKPTLHGASDKWPQGAEENQAGKYLRTPFYTISEQDGNQLGPSCGRTWGLQLLTWWDNSDGGCSTRSQSHDV